MRHTVLVQREGEQARFEKIGEPIGNKVLLWHGSRLTNYVGILSQGLRIAPPEAPVTGYMFGKGVYFADAVSKVRAHTAISNLPSRAPLSSCLRLIVVHGLCRHPCV